MTETLERIAGRLDPDEIVDRLGLTSEELLRLLEEQVFENLDKFYDVLEDDNE